ncbi:hypothetical protein [Microbacterium candidum]|uniref:PH domain-containing protein n=1 Tax=Microbacterium candidum TaxID=3041922 RepID=A0ABT7MZA3_9MICO|nr:hypothetical protein [Microbacterium sp. ASV49]MDL9979783.1 hypothetical protein [Microbacterium sp. ASV49]
MSHVTATILIVLFVAAVGAGALWGWSRRAKRDATPLFTAGELPADAHVHASFDTLYVATTRHDEPLERLAAPGLGMRSFAAVVIADAGVEVDLGGKTRFVLSPDRIIEVGQSTVVIDRVVEKDGLVRLVWRTDADTTVDSYFRPTDASARALADAIHDILPESAQGPDTGSGPASATDSQTGADA